MNYNVRIFSSKILFCAAVFIRTRSDVQNFFESFYKIRYVVKTTVKASRLYALPLGKQVAGFGNPHGI